MRESLKIMGIVAGVYVSFVLLVWSVRAIRPTENTTGWPNEELTRRVETADRPPAAGNHQQLGSVPVSGWMLSESVMV